MLIAIFVGQVFEIKRLELLLFHHAFPKRILINKHIVYFLNFPLKCFLEEGRVCLNKQAKKDRRGF